MEVKKNRRKRKHLDNSKTKSFIYELNKYFETIIEIPRIKVGKKQTIETLINEETLLVAKYLRKERKIWIPRLVNI